MSEQPLIYLDNAATSFPKPDSVYTAMDAYHRNSGVPVGRGAYRKSIELQSSIDQCRKLAAKLLGAARPEEIAFTFNGTDSLNTIIHGVLKPGDHVITSDVEHNSVLRTLQTLKDRWGLETTIVPADQSGLVEPQAFQNAIRKNTRLIILNHASNVTGTIQPVNDVGDIARNAGALFLVDAAQSAGHLPLNVAETPIDFLACPGHKGLLGPLGTGLVYIRSDLVDQVQSLRQGGTGTRSEEETQPVSMPEKFESGNHNAPGLIGLRAALEYVLEQGVAQFRQHEQQLTAQLLEGLQQLPGFLLPGPGAAEDRVGVVSLVSQFAEPQVLASILDENFGIQIRAGLHCAPRIHACIGSKEAGGTLRFSPGPFTTVQQIETAVAAMQELAQSFAG
ncbi:aminotransferase class V-fold PLP-dependent enzyme [Gimesia sp.]|uniref:aminotransferase class V-fold PLP-dependent enzyme n=1 Tax=Gimesia sp. TaxID=2024833 RepID=UPI000C60E097|nr:aminotransferase class V-fold PLP-dependent enzyme [Gimesia sp.]MAX38626.1 aminotransferase [Gimesia sp.]|tara:strand:+ start:1633 stop:2808 length:1176 start_codon:yes stop_codon:yes gene_type:complete